MARFEVFAGVQPYEEQQSPPSPLDERDQPTELQLALSRTRSPSVTARSPTSPTATLHRQLSGDPESPPPAWKRRPSTNTQRSSVSGKSYATTDSGASSTSYSPSVAAATAVNPQASHNNFQQQQQQQRRYHQPNLAMTRAGVAQRILQNEAPTSRSRPAPPPSFRGRRQGNLSNRSSMLSMEGLNSEELWTLEDDSTPDMSNPMRPSQERPLDTVRRMSQVYDVPVIPLPENLWPVAPPNAEYMVPTKNKSMTSLSGMKKRHTLRKSSSRATSILDPNTSPSLMPIKAKDGLSSAHSSSTDLSMPYNKSQASLANSRPGSMAYGFDLLSTLAPREGGYAIAAQIGGHHPQFSPTSSQHSYDDRRSFVGAPYTGNRSRAPSARSSGMMRLSGEGGDFDLPQPGRISTHTTSTSLSAMAGDEPDSPTIAPVMPAAMATPSAPSPLSQHTTAADVSAPPTPIADRAQQSLANGGPAAAAAAAAVHKSKKQLKAEEKARAKEAKLEAKRLADQQQKERSEAARQASEAKAKAKAEAIRKEKEEKERVKAEKKARKASKVSKPAASPSPAATPSPATSARPTPTRQRSTISAVPQANGVANGVPNGAPNGVPNGAPMPNGNANANGHAISNGALAAGAGAVAAAGAAAYASRSSPASRPNEVPIHARPLPSPPPRGMQPSPQRQGSSVQPAPQVAQQQQHAQQIPQQQASPSPRPLPSPSQMRVSPSPSQQRISPSPSSNIDAAPLTTAVATGPSPASSRPPSSFGGAPTPRSASSTSINSEQTARKKSGMLSSLKKRFSVVMDTPPSSIPGKPRPMSTIDQSSTPAVAPASAPAPPAAPVVIPPRQSSAIAIPPRQSSAALAKVPPSEPAQAPPPRTLPPPVIVPPRQSSLAIPGSTPGLSQSPDGSNDHQQPYASNSSSVVVTPTTSMATNSQPSLFDLRPSAPFRDRSDSVASGELTDGYASAVEDKEMPGAMPVAAH